MLDHELDHVFYPFKYQRERVARFTPASVAVFNAEFSLDELFSLRRELSVLMWSGACIPQPSSLRSLIQAFRLVHLGQVRYTEVVGKHMNTCQSLVRIGRPYGVLIDSR